MLKNVKAALIETVRNEYSKINTIDPDGPSYKKLTNLLDRCDDDLLIELSKADIKWVSSLALTRCIKRGLDF